MNAFVRYNGKPVSQSVGGEILVTPHIRTFEGVSLQEHWVTITNCGDAPIRIERVDSVNFSLPGASYELMYYTSEWGKEFEPVRGPLRDRVALHNRKGRSSNGVHPWFTLFGADGQVLTGTVMCSGNWIARFEPDSQDAAEPGIQVSVGLDDWAFFKDLAPGESMDSPHVAIAMGSNGDLNDTSIQFARAGRAGWYPKNLLSTTLPIEWNHGWSYEDKFINDDVFRKNVDEAARLGLDLCTLDAGWFGPSAEASDWWVHQGDWDEVNVVRFPSGIRVLSDYTHAQGLKFGLWCEIEAMGKQLPELPESLRDKYKHHAEVYKNYVRTFVSHADLYRLTEQPRREGLGSRWAGFQYAMPDASEHLPFVFRLHFSPSTQTLHLRNLDRARTYKLMWLSENRVDYFTGEQFRTRGVEFSTLREEESALILVL